MDQNRLRKPYDLLVSLGASCQTVYQLERKGLRRFACPFDWVQSDSLTLMNELLKNNMDRYFHLWHLKAAGPHGACYEVWDTHFKILSIHDFPLTQRSQDAFDSYQDFRKKIDRRIRRMLDFFQDESHSILFARVFGDSPNEASYRAIIQEFSELNTVLKEMVRGDFNILALAWSNAAHLLTGDWGMDNVFIGHIPNLLDRWEGSDADWDRVLEGISLKKPLPEAAPGSQGGRGASAPEAAAAAESRIIEPT